MLARRLDDVETIGQAVALKVTGDRGLRPIAEHLGVPHTTARSWWRRFGERSTAMIIDCTALAVSLNGTAVMVNTTGERAAVDVLITAWRRAEVRFGQHVGRVWTFWGRISGGYALGTNTTSPWARRLGADWTAPSALGGPGP